MRHAANCSGQFLVSNLSEIAWNDKAFDNLVLPGGEKELAWEFVEGKARSSAQVDDFVPDKGAKPRTKPQDGADSV